MLFSDPWEWSGTYKVTTDTASYWVSENGCEWKLLNNGLMMVELLQKRNWRNWNKGLRYGIITNRNRWSKR